MSTLYPRDLPWVPLVWLLNQFSANYIFCSPLAFWSQVQSPNSFSFMHTLSNSLPGMSLSAGPASIWVGRGGRNGWVSTTSSVVCETCPHSIFSRLFSHTLCHAMFFARPIFWAKLGFARNGLCQLLAPTSQLQMFPSFVICIQPRDTMTFPAEGCCAACLSVYLGSVFDL